ncbi:single-stranded DNA-binding protein, partial [Streptomyces sp. NPDC127092]|uniref:single-stranded DNA-binding protein n=1 Tax=Streptomyces sp. NPDC127092 TaxID=3347135 RepID=UPI00364A9C03
LFLRCSVWREAAENVAESLTKGMRVIVQGRLRARSYDDRDGNRRTSWELDVDEVGPALRFATAKVTRAQRGGGGGGGFGGAQQGGGWGGQQQGGGQAAPQDPWSGGGGGGWDTPSSNEPPF